MAEKKGMSQDLDRKQLMLVGGLFVVLLVVVWFFLLRGGGEDPAAELGAPPGIPIQTTAPITTPTPEGGEGEEVQDPEEGPVETFEVFARRDPFEPVVEVGGPPGVVDPVTPSDGSSPSPGTTPFDDGSGAESDDESDDEPSASQPPGTSRVKLIDAYKSGGVKRAQVRVDNTVYIAEEGETFAESFRLLSVSGKCASMLFGDDQFTLCEGDEVFK